VLLQQELRTLLRLLTDREVPVSSLAGIPAPTSVQILDESVAGSDWTAEVTRLVSELGVVSEIRAHSIRGLPYLYLYMVSAGHTVPGRVPRPDSLVVGAGRAIGDRDLARAIAIAEAAERYAGGAFFSTEPTLTRQGSLPGPEIDLSAVPRCSEREYTHPACPVTAPDWRSDMRWVTGRELRSGEDRWLPAVMTCYGLDRLPSERFWYPISTGYAVHSTVSKAVFSALCEVVERDAVAITWLQRLPLPRLPASVLDQDTVALIDWATRHFVDTHLFDATTDIGLPTVYVVLRADHDATAATTVSCSTGLTLTQAARRAVLEAITARIPAQDGPDAAPPEDYAEFSGITDGSRYMGNPRMRHAFDFLTSRPDTPANQVSLSRFADDEADGLRRLVGILGGLGMEVIVVDRTTRELAAVGLIAVSVVVPALQPMSVHPLAQFRAHPRLYSAPARMGHRVLAEEDLNHLPQPFA
jgi:ribosomal protein S12 methylthiotransferase accessory factor